MGIGVGIIALNENNEVLLLRNEDKILADSDMHLEGTYTLPSETIINNYLNKKIYQGE